jgi:hypothetical protein
MAAARPSRSVVWVRFGVRSLGRDCGAAVQHRGPVAVSHRPAPGITRSTALSRRLGCLFELQREVGLRGSRLGPDWFVDALCRDRSEVEGHVEAFKRVGLDG